MRNGISICAAAMLVASSAATAQTPTPPSQGNQKPLTVEKVKPGDSMLELRTAVRDLREASVRLLNEVKAGAARDEAFKSAQDAIAKIEMAMSKIKPDMSSTIKHDAKSWPVVAGRFDRAAAALEAAIDHLSKTSGGDQTGPRDSAQAALKEVQSAIHDLPNAKGG